MVDIDRLTDGVIADLRKMKTEGYTPPDMRVYEKQRLFINHPARFSAFVAGIGSGKTFGGAYKALKYAKPGTLGLVSAPTYGVLRDATVRTFKEVAGDYIESITRHPPIDCRMRNGAEILFRSAHDPDLLRGPSLSWFWGDEAALYTRDTWHVMIGRLREHGQAGPAWLTTTPKGRNWIYQEFVAKTRPDYWIIKAATRENPFISPEYYESLLEAYSGDFARQELEGDFIAFQGLIYSEFSRDVHMTTAQRPTSFKQVIAGVDWGFANPGVILVFGVDSDGRMHGLHEEHARRRRIEEWVTVAQQLQQQYQIESMYCDPSEPEFIAQFQRGGLPAFPADNEVIAGIQSVQNRLARQGDGLPRLLLPPSFVQTAAEFEQYIWMEHSTDGIRDKPRKANDHCLDALRYAARALDVFGESAYNGVMNYVEPFSISSSDY